MKQTEVQGDATDQSNRLPAQTERVKTIQE